MSRARSLWLLVVVLLSVAPARASPSALPEGDDHAWLSVGAFCALPVGAGGWGVLAALAVPLDVAARAPTMASARHGMRDPSVTHFVDPGSPSLPSLVVRPSLARAVVAAALRAAHVLDDEAIERAAARARASALLPEVRVRVLRITQDGAPDTTSSSSVYAGNHTWLEGRATFKLDRLLFAAEEVPLLRSQAERVVERGRITREVLAALARWQRANVEVGVAPANSDERLDAELRLVDAHVELDVLTDGAFSALLARATSAGARPE